MLQEGQDGPEPARRHGVIGPGEMALQRRGNGGKRGVWMETVICSLGDGFMMRGCTLCIMSLSVPGCQTSLLAGSMAGRRSSTSTGAGSRMAAT